MARKTKADIKLNKNHGGKEFSNKFQFVGQVKPVQKKDEASDNWYDVEFFDVNTTRTGRERRTLQFMLETAPYNNLKLELSGMEMDYAYLYSRTDKATHRIDFNSRFDKSKYPNETYHLIDTDWDKTEKLGKILNKGIWVDVKGHYEFDTFTTDDGDEIKLVKRIIDNVTPLKNGVLEITGLKSGDTFRAYSEKEGGNFLGQGKASKEGVASVKVGWLNPEGGKLYVCKVDNNTEGSRVEVPYSDGTLTTDRFTVTNNNVLTSVRVDKATGGYEYIDYIMDFNDEEFKEINSFEMQLGIRSTYQESEESDTIVNGVYLDYGKERSTPKDIELKVYYKKADEGKISLATAFSRLNPLDFMVVQGIDNNRAETTLVEVEEKEEDNPFEDVGEKVVSYERVSSGTKKGLEITSYVTGTFTKGLLTEEEISTESSILTDDPFADTGILEDDLPF